MRKILLTAALLALIGGGIAVAAAGSDADVPRDPARADCPGLIQCPLTGEEICADRCPLDGENAAALPPCCQGAK